MTHVALLIGCYRERLVDGSNKLALKMFILRSQGKITTEIQLKESFKEAATRQI